MDLVARLKGLLGLIERDGDLHLAAGTPAQIGTLYPQLAGMGLIRRSSLHAPHFWELTVAGQEALAAAEREESLTAAAPQKGVLARN